MLAEQIDGFRMEVPINYDSSKSTHPDLCHLLNPTLACPRPPRLALK